MGLNGECPTRRRGLNTWPLPWPHSSSAGWPCRNGNSGGGEVRGQGEEGVGLVRGRLRLVGRCIGLVGVEGREMGARPPTLKVGAARSRQGMPVMQDRYP